MAKNKWINKKMIKKKIRPSAQNPSSTKYRDQAKEMLSTGYVTYPKKTVHLTVENLEAYQHIIDKSFDSDSKNLTYENSDQMSVISNLSNDFSEKELKALKGYQDDVISETKTFASDFTCCSNQSFSYFLQKFDGSSQMHQEMLSILAAATEIINSKNRTGTDEEYYFILINSLYTNKNILSLNSNIILLFYVIKRLSKEFLNNKFGEFQKLVAELIKKHMNSINTTFFRFLFKSYIIFLNNLNQTDWDLFDIQTNFIDNLLRFTTHTKSKIRKLSRQSIVKLFKNLTQENEHPIFKMTVEFSIKKIHSTTGEDVTEALHILNLWKETIIYFPITQLKQLFENILSLLMLGNALVYSNSMQVLENFFMYKTNCCTSDLNNKIILALNECQPSLNDTQPLLAWSYVMKLAELNLHKLDKNLFINHFPKLFEIYFSCFQNSNLDSEKFITSCIVELLNTIMDDSADVKPDIFLSIGETLNYFLSLKYSSSLKYILKIVSTFFKLSGKEYELMIEKLFDKVLYLKNSDANAVPDYLCDNIFKNLIIHHGVEFLLKKLPLQPDLNHFTIKNAWLIEIIRKHVKKDKIGNFIKYILNVSDQIYKDPKTFVNQDGSINSKNLWLFHHTNLWSLLPIFLNEPTDIQESFNKIAKNLGILLKDAPHLRNFILKSLRQLIIKSLGEDKLEIAKYAKNYIPILLNLYLIEGPKSKSLKLAIYATLYYMFSIADEQLINSIHEKLIENKRSEKEIKKVYLFYDLLRCIICNLKNEEKIIQTLNEGLSAIEDNSKHHEQKKGFRLIEELLKSNNHLIIEKYFQSKNQNFYNIMFKYFMEKFSYISILAAQASFIRILQHLVVEKYKEKKMNIEELKLHSKLLVEIFNSKKSHKLSNSLFDILYTIIDYTESGQTQSILILIDLLNEENIGVDKKATIFFMLHNILQKYNENIDRETKTILIQSLLHNLNSQYNKMVKIILSFIRDWFKMTTRDEMLRYIDPFVKYLNSIENLETYLIRFKIKNIIEKLLKKFGSDMIISMLDDKYKRLIRNLNKKTRKNKLSKKQKDDECSELSDNESEIDENKSKIKTSKRGKRWNFNDNEEDDGEFKIFDQANLNKFNENNFNEVIDNNIEIDKKQAVKKKNDILEIDKEGNIIDSDNEDNNNQKEDNLSDSDSDNNDNAKISKFNSSKNILNKYRRKRGIHRDLKNNFKSGNEYRSKRAHGDMKKNDAPEPYAYLPLNRSILSKRKSLKNKTKIKHLIKAAFKGASNAKPSSNRNFKKK